MISFLALWPSKSVTCLLVTTSHADPMTMVLCVVFIVVMLVTVTPAKCV